MRRDRLRRAGESRAARARVGRERDAPSSCTTSASAAARRVGAAGRDQRAARAARARGKRVVRLKGGDPFVFGRGSEEAQALAAAGVPFEVVPGVTAGIAAPAYAGIPVTHRGVATSVTFVTGHEDPAKDASSTDWAALARAGGTIVLYMGVKTLPRIAAALIAGGMLADTPAAVGAVGNASAPANRDGDARDARRHGRAREG